MCKYRAIYIAICLSFFWPACVDNGNEQIKLFNSSFNSKLWINQAVQANDTLWFRNYSPNYYNYRGRSARDYDKIERMNTIFKGLRLNEMDYEDYQSDLEVFDSIQVFMDAPEMPRIHLGTFIPSVADDGVSDSTYFDGEVYPYIKDGYCDFNLKCYFKKSVEPEFLFDFWFYYNETWLIRIH